MINKNCCVDNSITGISNCLGYTYNNYYTGMTLLDKYYKVVKKACATDLPVAAQRDILKLINDKRESKLQFSIDYLTIELDDENEHAQHQTVCHVVIKEVLDNYYSIPTVNYNTPLSKPIEFTCSATCEGEQNSKFVVNSNTDYINKIIE